MEAGCLKVAQLLMEHWPWALLRVGRGGVFPYNTVFLSGSPRR